jgi:hypothetical protein
MLDLPEGWHSNGVELSDGKLATHSASATAQLDELPTTTGETWDIRIAASKSWDAASGTENAGSGTVDAELASMHDLGTGL